MRDLHVQSKSIDAVKSQRKRRVASTQSDTNTQSEVYCPRCSYVKHNNSRSALDISTGPLARGTFQTAGPVRASTFYLSLARTGHLDICRATRFQIVLARTMTNHSMYFSRGRPSHNSAVFAQSFCYSETPACRESELGMSIKHTDVSV